MAEANQMRLRQTFDEAAELYDRARPGYPPGVFDDLAELAGVGPGCRVLEIGCGTGQATVPLAERGCQIVAVELGAGLAAVARRKLARFPSVGVVVSAGDRESRRAHQIPDSHSRRFAEPQATHDPSALEFASSASREARNCESLAGTPLSTYLTT